MYNFFALGKFIYFDGYSGYILDFKQGDVTGDGIIDNVYLIGDRPYGFQSPFVANINLVVQDGASLQYTRVPIKDGSGYNPTIFLGDFTGDKVDDIVVYIDSGSGAILYSYIYSFVDNKPSLLFDHEKFNKEFQYEVIFRDNFEVDVISFKTKKKFTIDISYKGEEYLWEIYNEDGTLKEGIKGFVNAISGLYPIDFDRDGVYELMAVQKVAGRYNADAIGYVETDLKWNGRSFVAFRQEIGIFGENILSIPYICN